jgi:Big-like domain-containing protein
VFQLFGPMTGLVIRRNTIWTPGGGSPTTLRDPGWGSVVVDSNVISRAWSDTSAPFGAAYTATNNIAGSAPEGTWPGTGISVVHSPAFQNPSADDYRTNDGRGVDWAPAEQSYGPDGSDSGGGTTPPPDTSAPNTTISSGPTGPTNDATPTFAFDSDESGATFTCRVDSDAWAECTSPWTTSTLADGAHSVSVRATDAAGHTEAAPPTRSFTVDTVSPHTTITSPPPATSTSDRASIAFTVDEADSTSQCLVDAHDWVGCSSPYEVSGLQPGAHTVVVRSRDAAGNVESPGASATWTVDVTPGGGDPGEPPPTTDAPPTADLTAPAPGSAVQGNLRLAASASDDHGVDHVEFWVDDTRVASDTGLPYATWVDADQLSSGTRTVAVRAFDAAGQAASSARTVRVVRYGQGWGRSRRWAELASAAKDGGITQLTGHTSDNGVVVVDLTPCDSADATVVDRFSLRADDQGHLDAVYAGAGLCVLRLQPQRS